MDALLRRRQMMLAGGTPPAPLPYTPVEYIVTDGNCYILPGGGFAATPPKSCEMKVKMPTSFTQSTVFSLLAGYLVASGSNAKAFALARYYNKTIAFTYYSSYGSGDGMPSIAYSLDNDKPFIIKNDIKKGSQHVSVKQENSDSWTTVAKANNNNVSSSYQFAILAAYRNSQYEDKAPSGTRLYYCKIYSDETYTNLVFDGVPCLYNGEYGLWDKVSDTFKGNANSTGAFSGPSNS